MGYNLNGIADYARLFLIGLLLAIVATLISFWGVIKRKFKKESNREKKKRLREEKFARHKQKRWALWVERGFCVFAIVLMLGNYCFAHYKFTHPQIEVHEGYFFRTESLGTYRSLYHYWGHEYSFYNGDHTKRVFKMSTPSKKEIFPEEFSSKKKYRIYYEKDLCIIVKVEEIE